MSGQTLWLGRLPDGSPRALATERRIASPEFSPDGRWVFFLNDDVQWIASVDSQVARAWRAGRNERADRFGETKPDLGRENAGFSASGRWRVYWKAGEMSASVRADGLDLYAMGRDSAAPVKLGVATLVHPDMLSVSPTKELVAVTAGLGRETWANKAIGTGHERGFPGVLSERRKAGMECRSRCGSA